MSFVVVAASATMLRLVGENTEPLSFVQHRAGQFVPAVRDYEDELFVLDALDDGAVRRLADDVLAPCSPTVVVCGDAEFAAAARRLAMALDVPLVTAAPPVTWLQEARQASAVPVPVTAQGAGRP